MANLANSFRVSRRVFRSQHSADERDEHLITHLGLRLGLRWGYQGAARTWGVLASALLLTLGSAAPLFAADPFRSSNPAVGEKTGEAFELIFRDSDYRGAQALLDEAAQGEADEPLLHTLQALLYYRAQENNGGAAADWSPLNRYASQTQSAAASLKSSTDEQAKLRGNLYLAMAEFLNGAYAISENGPVRGMSSALGKLRGIYSSMRTARQIDKDDPELNLVQGFLDLITSIYLPLSDTQAAIRKLESVRETNPEAAYLADWAMATGYRAMKKNDKALEAIDRALAAQPDHAEMSYLKAQILASQGDRAAAASLFKIALQKSETMPDNLVAQIFIEACRNNRELNNIERNCDAPRDAIRDDATDPWGPAAVSLLSQL